MRILKILTVSTPVLAGILAVAAISAQAADIKVNGVVIPQSRVDLAVKDTITRSHGQQQDTPELRNAIRNGLIDREIVSQEAISKGLDKDPDLVANLEAQKQQLLVQAFAEDYIKNHPVSEDQIKQEYETRKTQLAGKNEYKIRHIDLKTEQDAKSIIEQLKKGASWEKLAKDKSQDPNADWMPETISPNQVPAPFVAAVKGLKKGHTTEAPVQTQFGWHVIRVDDIRPMTMPSYDVAKPQLLQMLQTAELRKAMDDLRAKAKIEQ